MPAKTKVKLLPLLAIAAIFLGVLIFSGPGGTAQVSADAPAHGQGVNLVGLVDPHNLPTDLSPSHGSKRFLHAGGSEDLSRGKAEAISLAPGAGVIASQPIEGATLPTTGVGFEGINANQTLCGCLPPDGDIAEGNGYLVGAVNTAYEVWNKQGQSLVSPTDFLLFFYGCNDFLTYTYLSDPIVEYDAGAGRFVMGAITFDASLNKSRLCLAVSQTSDPTGSWYVYYLNVTPPSPYNSDILDFPQLAIGSDALYITGNQYVNATNVYAGTRFYALRKSLLYAGQGDSSGGVYHDVAASNQETAMPVRGVATANTMYFVAADTVCPCSNASLWEWQDPFGTDTFTFNGSVQMLPSYDQPPDAQQPGGTIVTNDSRVLGAYWTDATSSPTIYAVQTIACNPGSGTVACVHWFQLKDINTTATMASQGTIATDGVDSYYPNVAVDKVGHAVIGFASSSSTTYAGIRVYDIDSASETLIKSGNATIDGRRYGDYAGMAVDSADGCTIWHFEEYANGAYLWDTWASSVVHNDCLTGTLPTATPTATDTASPSATFTPTATDTPAPSPTSTSTPVASPTSTYTPTPSATPFCPRGQKKKGTC